MSGVGISFGADRIYDVMTELDLFPSSVTNTTTYLFINFGTEEQIYSIQIAAGLRRLDIPCEIYPEPKAMKKQMKYANNRHIPFVVLVGSDELKNGTVTLKNMVTGEQETLTKEDFLNKHK